MALPGVTFSPFDQGSKTATPQNSAVQDAIKILSFRMPTVVGAGAPAPQALLGGQTGAGGGMQSALMQELLKRLFQGQGLQAPPQEGAASVPGLSVPLGSPQTTSFTPGSNPFTPQAAGPLPSVPAPGGSFPLPNIQIGQQPGEAQPVVDGNPLAALTPTTDKSIFDTRYLER